MSDNQFFGCPAMMSDGRFLSTYQSQQVIIDAMKRANGINLCRYDPNDMRWWMQRNAERILQRERLFLLANNRCQTPKKPLVIELPFDK